MAGRDDEIVSEGVRNLAIFETLSASFPSHAYVGLNTEQAETDFLNDDNADTNQDTNHVSNGTENAVVALKNKKKKPVETHFLNDENESINQIPVKHAYIPVDRLPRPPCIECSKEYPLNSYPQSDICYMVQVRFLKDENAVINQVPVNGLQRGQSLPCKECSKEHPPDSYCPCDVCYRPHHSGVCSYFRYIPQGAAFSPQYHIICQCGNDFDEDKWACTFCGGGNARLKSKYCFICHCYKDHNEYECPKDQARAAVYKSIRDEARRPVERIPYQHI